MAGYISEGTTIVLPGVQTAESVVELVDCIAWCPNAIASGDNGTGIILGTVEIAKATGTAYAAGDFLYWNTTANNLTKTSSDTPVGLCVKAAASGATSAYVSLNVGVPDAAVS